VIVTALLVESGVVVAGLKRACQPERPR